MLGNSRYARIQELQKENIKLKDKILAEQRYVEQIDEYFLIKNKPYDEFNFNEKRIDILKA